MKVAYPVFIKQAGGAFLVFIPDMDIYTEGDSLADAIEMARDAIGLKGVDMEDDKCNIPTPSDMEGAVEKAKADADEDFDYSDGIVTYVDVDFGAYRRQMRNRAVKKNCTIPYWMSVEADKIGLNYSRLLQDAIVSAIGVNHARP